MDNTEPIKTNVKKIINSMESGYIMILTNDKKAFYYNQSPATHNHREFTGNQTLVDIGLSDVDDISTYLYGGSQTKVFLLVKNEIYVKTHDSSYDGFQKISVPENIIIDKLQFGLAITKDGDVYEIISIFSGNYIATYMQKIELNSEKIQSISTILSVIYHNYCFLTNEGNVYVIMINKDFLKQIFGIERNTNDYTPIKIDFFNKNVSKMVNGLFITKDGDVYGGGHNSSGYLGIQLHYVNLGYSGNGIPITKVPYLKNVSHVGTVGLNDAGSLFITDNGNIYTCGISQFNGRDGLLKREVGISMPNSPLTNYPSSPVPRLIDNYEQWKTIINCGKPTKKHIRAITTTAGSECTFLLISDDTESIVLGVGKISGFIPGFANNNEKTFKKMTGLPSVIRIDDISTSQQNLLFVKNDGSVYGAGQNANYQLGLGQNISRNYFVTSRIQPRVIQVATGNDYSLFLKYDGNVFITGSGMSIRYIKNPASTTDIHLKNEQSQKNITEEQITPVLIGGTGNIVQISSGPSHAAFLDIYGKVYHSHIGQLEFPSFLPAINNQGEVIDASEIVQVSCGKLFTLFLKIDGTVQSLGYNSHGQLGDGTTTSRTSLVNIYGLSDIEQVSAGLSHSAFLKKDGTVFACGNNNKGQLGDGTTTNKLTPTNVQDIYDVKQVTCGTAHTVFVTKSDQVFACGANEVGQLGDNTYVDKLKPVNVFNIDDLSNY